MANPIQSPIKPTIYTSQKPGVDSHDLGFKDMVLFNTVKYPLQSIIHVGAIFASNLWKMKEGKGKILHLLITLSILYQ